MTFVDLQLLLLTCHVSSYNVVEMEVQFVLEYPLHDLVEGGFFLMFQNVH